MSDALKIDFGDGVSALDRTMRAIVMLVDGAISELEALGFDRHHDMITIRLNEDGDPFPTWVCMGDEVLYEVNIEIKFEVIPPTMGIVARWLKKPKKRNIFRRLLMRVFGI